MSKKQTIWLIIAVLILACTGCLGIRQASNERQARQAASDSFSDLFAGLSQHADYTFDFPDGPFAAYLPVDGTIASAADAAALAAGSFYDHQFTLDYIDALIDESDNTGILLYINSPGGTMNAADELYLKLMDYKEATGRPIYCYFGDYACSGGYYVAMPADEICANRNSTCVNIGVYISTYNLSGLFEKLGVEQMIFRSSDNKGIGMPGVAWTAEQKQIYQSMVDIHYNQFLDIVAEGRGLTREQVKQKNDGREMLAPQALEAGLIDSIDRYDSYRDSVLTKLGTETLYTPEPSANPLNSLFGYISSLVPRSESQILLDFADRHTGLTVMAYDANY